MFDLLTSADRLWLLADRGSDVQRMVAPIRSEHNNSDASGAALPNIFGPVDHPSLSLSLSLSRARALGDVVAASFCARDM